MIQPSMALVLLFLCACSGSSISLFGSPYDISYRVNESETIDLDNAKAEVFCNRLNKHASKPSITQEGETKLANCRCL
jgi:hypothetical protein